MMPCRGMGDINPAKIPRANRRGDDKPVIGTGKPIRTFKRGGAAKADYTQYNARILKALIKRYGDEDTAREMMRTMGGGELLRVMREEESSYAKGGKVKSKSKVNEAGNYTKPGMRKKLFESIKASGTHGTKPGQWSARKAQLLAKKYKEKGGGYKA
jgi:hypothetical protein